MKKIFFLIFIMLSFNLNSYSQNKYSEYLENLKKIGNFKINFRVENFSSDILKNFWEGKYEVSPEVIHFLEVNSLITREFYIVEGELYEKIQDEWIRKRNNIEIFEFLGLVGENELISPYLGYKFLEGNLCEFYPSAEFFENLFNKVYAEAKDIIDKDPTGKLWINNKLNTIEKIEIVANYTNKDKEKFTLKSLLKTEDVGTPLNITLPKDLNKKVYNYIIVDVDNYSKCQLENLISNLGKRKEKLNAKGKIYKEDKKIIIRIPYTENKKKLEKVLSSFGNLEFRLIWDDEKRVKKATLGEIPTGFEILYKDNFNPLSGEVYRKPYLVKKKNELSQELIESVKKEINKYNNLPQVILKFNAEGKEKIKEFTEKNTGKTLSIVMDGKILSLNKIIEPVYSGIVIIQDNLTEEESDEIFVILDSGKFPCQVKIEKTK